MASKKEIDKFIEEKLMSKMQNLTLEKLSC